MSVSCISRITKYNLKLTIKMIKTAYSESLQRNGETRLFNCYLYHMRISTVYSTLLLHKKQDQCLKQYSSQFKIANHMPAIILIFIGSKIVK